MGYALLGENIKDYFLIELHVEWLTPAIYICDIVSDVWWEIRALKVIADAIPLNGSRIWAGINKNKKRSLPFSHCVDATFWKCIADTEAFLSKHSIFLSYRIWIHGVWWKFKSFDCSLYFYSIFIIYPWYCSEWATNINPDHLWESWCVEFWIIYLKWMLKNAFSYIFAKHECMS